MLTYDFNSIRNGCDILKMRSKKDYLFLEIK